MISAWDKLLERPHSGGHFVQLYQADEGALARNVGHYLWEGLRRGEGVLLIATQEHQMMFSKRLDALGADLPAVLGSRQLVVQDARQTLSRFLVDGQPDWRLFENVIHALMRQVRPASGAGLLRAYGEMVGILWNDRQFAAAIRLEQLWNKLLEQSAFSLYCAYAVDIFGKEFEVDSLEAVLCAHSHLVPAQPDGTLEAALNRSMDEILGPQSDTLRVRIKANHCPDLAIMPAAEKIVLWLRANLPAQADEIVDRARAYCRPPHDAAQAAENGG